MQEGEVDELEVNLVQSQPIGDRDVDVEGFAGNPQAPFGTHRAERPHIVQAVCELDQNDADVARHGQ